MNRKQIIAMWMGIGANLLYLALAHVDYKGASMAEYAVVGLYHLVFAILAITLVTVGVILSLGTRKP